MEDVKTVSIDVIKDIKDKSEDDRLLCKIAENKKIRRTSTAKYKKGSYFIISQLCFRWAKTIPKPDLDYLEFLW